MVHGWMEEGVIPARFWTKAFMRDTSGTLHPPGISRASSTFGPDPHHWIVRGAPASELSITELERVLFKDPARSSAWSAYVARRKDATLMNLPYEHTRVWVRDKEARKTWAKEKATRGPFRRVLRFGGWSVVWRCLRLGGWRATYGMAAEPLAC